MTFTLELSEFVRISRAYSKLIQIRERASFYKRMAGDKKNREDILNEYLDMLEKVRLQIASAARRYYVT